MNGICDLRFPRFEDNEKSKKFFKLASFNAYGILFLGVEKVKSFLKIRAKYMQSYRNSLDFKWFRGKVKSFLEILVFSIDMKGSRISKKSLKFFILTNPDTPCAWKDNFQKVESFLFNAKKIVFKVNFIEKVKVKSF